MSDTPTGETATQQQPKNDATPTSTPQPEVKAEDNAAVEQLKKELAQTQMRNNQLENEKKAREEAEAKKKEQELEEQNEFKTLYEQERTKREEFEREKEENEKKQKISAKSQEVFSDYPDEVRILAEEAGLNLTDESDESVTTFKGKLDKIKDMLGEKKVTPNNPKPDNSKPTPSREEMADILRDPNKFHDFVTDKFPGISAMTRSPRQ